MDTCDRRPIEQCLSHDDIMQRSARRRLVERHKTMVYGMVRGVLGGTPQADDAFQDTFERVLRNLHLFHGRCPLAWWIGRIAVNSALRQIRQERTSPSRPNYGVTGEHDKKDMLGEMPAHGANPERRLAAREVLHALSALPPVRRVTLTLSAEGFSDEEIARITGTNASTVGTRKFRARRELAELLKPATSTPTERTGRSMLLEM